MSSAPSDILPIYMQMLVYTFCSVIGGGVIVFASIIVNLSLPENKSWKDRFTWIWLAFDAMIHCIFLILISFSRTVSTSFLPFADLWKEHVHADAYWGFSDTVIVWLDILIILGAGPMCCYSLKQLTRDDSARHYWSVVLSTAELYRGWMTFCSVWPTGNQYLNTDNTLHFCIYLLMNVIWATMPMSLMIISVAGPIAHSPDLVV